MLNINKLKIKFIIWLLLVVMFVPINLSWAAMRSNSYIIYENIHHSFDGPVISDVSASVSEQSATVTWNTDIIADAYVIYSTEASFATSYEQGSSVKSAIAHSVIVSGLDPSQTYYYRVRSERINGGVTTDTTERTFMTEAEAVSPETPSSGGGGILIIDKTDKIPPEISNINISDIGAQTISVEWETNEEATSFVEYGEGDAYGNVYGEWGTSTEHSVNLERLKPATAYSFRVLSSDSWGNIAYSDKQSFVTLTASGEEVIPEDEPEEEDELVLPAEGLAELTQNVIDFLLRLFPDLNLEDLVNINNINELSDYMDTPNVIGEPIIDVSADEVTISWQTDIESNSMVAIAPNSAYNTEEDDPYQQVIGNSNEYVTNHELTLYGLIPDTSYHLQIRSAAPLGPGAESSDYTFRTSQEELQILSYLTQIVDNETASFKWTTNKEADSSVTFTPYFEGVLGLDQQKTIKNNNVSVVHEILIDEFVGGTFYEVEILSTDNRGNEARKIITQFSTTENDLAPIISHVKADSTVFVDRSDQIQTIISWLTNEPATSQVYYQEGVHSATTKLTESTSHNTNYTREHMVVVSKFKPGLVYSFRVESVDSGGNTVISKLHTFMTAKKKESIITVIMNILENTFGWMKKLM
ncbi:MAG: fibronectin type III domain-containing protein [Patescibacteria group bacterium]|nr:fibronectin type III domain-containing protein [Patescibacteria group bacterium]